MDNFKYEILNYWNDVNELYIHYRVKDLIKNEEADVINYFDITDLECNYNNATHDEIIESMYKLIERNDGKEFIIPKVSELSPLLKYVYDCVCESDSNMCHIDYGEWIELKEDHLFDEEDIITLYEEINKYYLDDYIIIDDGEYKICGYGGLQCCFNDDRNIRDDKFER